MTMLQNQTTEAPPNVLHDQGVPNTLARMGPPVVAGPIRFPMAILVIVMVTIVVVVVVAIVAGRSV